MSEFNLLMQYPKAVRNLSARKKNKAANKELAKRFGKEYFDGTRDQGYGGYNYDGRWVPIAKRIINRYSLKSGDKVLDIGCAKGYLLRDLQDQCPGLKVYGLDLSTYAIENADENVQDRLVVGNAEKLPFPTNYFEFVIAINVIHNLQIDRCKNAILEIKRVTKNNSYIQVDAYRNKTEKKLFMDWVLRAETYGTPIFWKALFGELNYSGDYYWTIIEEDTNVING